MHGGGDEGWTEQQQLNLVETPCDVSGICDEASSICVDDEVEGWR